MGNSMKTEILMTLVVAGGFCCPIGTQAAEESVLIGQPTIFWHNGEWQTCQDGVWTPYDQTPAIAEQASGGVDASSLVRHGTIVYFASPTDGQAARPGIAGQPSGDVDATWLAIYGTIIYVAPPTDGQAARLGGESAFTDGDATLPDVESAATDSDTTLPDIESAGRRPYNAS